MEAKPGQENGILITIIGCFVCVILVWTTKKNLVSVQQPPLSKVISYESEQHLQHHGFSFHLHRLFRMTPKIPFQGVK